MKKIKGKKADEILKICEKALGYYADTENYLADRAELSSVMLDMGSSARSALDKVKKARGKTEPVLSLDDIHFY